MKILRKTLHCFTLQPFSCVVHNSVGTAYYWIQKKYFCIILMKADLGLRFDTMFSAGVGAFLFFTEEKNEIHWPWINSCVSGLHYFAQVFLVLCRALQLKWILRHISFCLLTAYYNWGLGTNLIIRKVLSLQASFVVSNE